MKFLSASLSTRFTPLTLLDLSYLVALLPVALTLKAPMLAFVFIAGSVIFLKKTPAKNPLIVFIFLLGVLAVYFSLYGAFSFRGLSRLKLFIELLIYALLVVVAMQRLTRKINFYLIISPFLFLALSLFFYQGMAMLVYVIFEIFFLLWMVLAHRMQGDLIESFRSSMVMFMYSLPWVVALFIFFPRISFEHASYGFKGEAIKRMGHDGTMYLDANALLAPSGRIVMEVGFDGPIPTSNALYFRGSLLYVDKKDHWEPMPSYVKRKDRLYDYARGETIDYQVTLYPTQKRWLYMLDMPAESVKNSILDRDLVSTVKEDIKEPIRYGARSRLSSNLYDVLDEQTLEASTLFDQEQNPQTYKVAQSLKKTHHSSTQRAAAIMRFFKERSLIYTLKPDALDVNHSTDDFLFSKRHGYCVHFASSFVTMARMAGIPSRIVTGYKADSANGFNNYLAVKESDAHAWAELYMDKRWVRVETTATALRVDEQTQMKVAKEEQNQFYKKVNLYLMYAKYQVETWILYYSNARQLQLLQYSKENPRFIFIFVTSLLVLLLVTFAIISYFRRPSYGSEAIGALQPLLKALKKEGHIRQEEETLHQCFLRYMEKYPHKTEHISYMRNIDTLYEQISYGGKDSKSEQKRLKSLVKRFILNKFNPQSSSIIFDLGEVKDYSISD